ncbi:MAG: 4-(cytidine 5'-diphospho)-2-C-methyl-D-erythritol kinase [Gracilibacteraceae bacterium]|jgi:4-diphosphocytidyl-2-C-methyl-D-erythritol kinase|nr:4-(cytidine 5'-diphospho)-2-C-methyl-D-erythritol kinase [Gracilibacteraceae bacterium]
MDGVKTGAGRNLTVTETARAKVNLALAVGDRGSGGLHLLTTVMQTISLADSVSLTLRPDGEIDCRCFWADDDRPDAALSGPDNLAVTAVRQFEAELRRKTEQGLPGGLNIQIKKRIPLQAGLGGGSADAAAVLRGLNRLWGAPLNYRELQAAARRCGADTPFCLRGGVQWAEGTGTTLSPLPPPPALPVVVAQPGAGMSTAEAYRSFDRIGRAEQLDKADWRRRLRRGEGRKIAAALHNNFEPVVAAVLPITAEIKRFFLAAGCLGALLCGSGSAVFALPPDEAAGRLIARRVEAELSCRTWVAAFDAVPEKFR